MPAYNRILLPWDRQPQELAALNPEYPGADRITTLIPFGRTNRDIVGGKFLTLSSGGSIHADQRGLSLKGSGSAAVASMALNLSAYDKLTLSFWLYWDAYASDDDFAMEFTADSNSNDGFYVDPNYSGSGGQFGFQVGSVAGNRKTAYMARSLAPAATWNHFFVVWDRSIAGLSTSVWVNGVAVSLTAVNTGVTLGNFANSTLFIFSRNNANLFGAGRLQNLVIRGGYLGTQADASYEYANPWQLFAPQSIWVPVSAGAGGATYTITPSGGITIGGDSVDIKGKVLAVSGGVALTGTGNITFTSGGTTFTITPSGGVTISGSGWSNKGKVFIPTGGVVISGTANRVKGKIFSPTGNVLFSGTGTISFNGITPPAGVDVNIVRGFSSYATRRNSPY
jgi:hypothetical protein